MAAPSAPAAFRVTLPAGTGVRARLYLGGTNAPRSASPLIDTAGAACATTSAGRTCSAAYQSLPAGRYTWKVVTTAVAAGSVRLRVRW